MGGRRAYRCLILRFGTQCQQLARLNIQTNYKLLSAVKMRDDRDVGRSPEPQSINTVENRPGNQK